MESLTVAEFLKRLGVLGENVQSWLKRHEPQINQVLEFLRRFAPAPMTDEQRAELAKSIETWERELTRVPVMYSDGTFGMEYPEDVYDPEDDPELN